MEGLELLAGGALLFAGWLMGRFTRKPPPDGGDPPAKCGCGHHYSFHPDGGACAYAYNDWHWGYDDQGRRARIFKTCTCQRYSGPLPLESYTAGT